jgi:hypothetical protein
MSLIIRVLFGLGSIVLCVWGAFAIADQLRDTDINNELGRLLVLLVFVAMIYTGSFIFLWFMRAEFGVSGYFCSAFQ